MVSQLAVEAEAQAAVSFRNVVGDIVLGPVMVPLSTHTLMLQRKVAEALRQAPSQVDLVMGTRKLLHTDDVASLGCHDALVLDLVMNSPAVCEVTPHRFENIYCQETKALTPDSGRVLTRSLAPGASVILEDRVVSAEPEEAEYRVWCPYRCRLVAAILGGIGCFPIVPGTTVLFTNLGPQLLPSVSYISDIVGAEGRVLVTGGLRGIEAWAGERRNIVELSGAEEEELLLGCVDVVLDSAAAEGGWARSVASSLARSRRWLRPRGWALHVVDASEEAGRTHGAFQDVVNAIRSAEFRPREQITLEPWYRHMAVIVSQNTAKKCRDSD